ncbi:MAG: hypothetical protein LBI35_03990 [Burkholderiales bacterium]|jgi:hypothetical protein|nr:hypothetical protein [Burkholderiales bacterium]
MKITQGVTVGVLIGVALLGIGAIGLLGFPERSAMLSADSRYHTEATITLADDRFGGFSKMAAASVGANTNMAGDDFDEWSSRFAARQDTRANGLLLSGNEIKFSPDARTDGNGASEVLAGDTPATLTIAWKAPSEKTSDIGVRSVTPTYFY